MSSTLDSKKILAALAEPFDVELIGWKPTGKPFGNRHLVCAYIDARDVAERLDAVVGIGNWKDRYEIHPSGSVICRLSVKLDGAWVTKVDVGSPSEQPDEGDRLKAAFSDALKRAAVKFGVARYLYRLGDTWADWDADKKRVPRDWKPQLPDWAKPHPKVKEEPVDLKQLQAGLAILAQAVPMGRAATEAAAQTLSPAIKKAIGKVRYEAYILLAEACDELAAAAAPKSTNGKHKAAQAASPN